MSIAKPISFVFSVSHNIIGIRVFLLSYFFINFSKRMKKGENVSKTILTSEETAKVHRSVDDSCNQQTPKVSSMAINRKTKSSQDSDKSRSRPSSLGERKLSLERKSSVENSLSKYNVDELSTREMHDSLIRLKENAVEPFTFLCNILHDNTTDDHAPIERIKLTEIDLKLAGLTRRVQLNKSLLERTNERVREINFFIERNATIASKELNYDGDESNGTKESGDNMGDSETALNIACPGIMELKRTINVTKDMLGYVRKICNNEIAMNDLPKELSCHMRVKN